VTFPSFSGRGIIFVGKFNLVTVRLKNGMGCFAVKEDASSRNRAAQNLRRRKGHSPGSSKGRGTLVEGRTVTCLFEKPERRKICLLQGKRRRCRGKKSPLEGREDAKVLSGERDFFSSGLLPHRKEKKAAIKTAHRKKAFTQSVWLAKKMRGIPGWSKFFLRGFLVEKRRSSRTRKPLARFREAAL